MSSQIKTLLQYIIKIITGLLALVLQPALTDWPLPHCLSNGNVFQVFVFNLQTVLVLFLAANYKVMGVLTFCFFSSSKNLLKQISLLGYSGVAEISSSAPADRSCGHQTRIVLARPPLKSHFSKWTSIQHVSLSLAFLAAGRFHSPTKLAVVKMLTFKIPN